MPEKILCSMCEEKIGGMIGATLISTTNKEKLDGVGYLDKDTSSLCQRCANNVVEELRTKYSTELSNIRDLFSSLLPKINVFTIPYPESWNAEIKGIVSGYSVIGTGPISAMASAWTDFFGQESTAYLDKIRIGENNAMLAARMQAAELGASAISGCTVTVTEATSGHGMLMVSCVGTAIARGSDDELASKIHTLHGEITALREQLKKLE